MRLSSLVLAAIGLLAIASMIPPAGAQELQVNQRFTAPTAQSDVAVSQLILALGLTLQGATDLHDRAIGYRLPAGDAPGSMTSRRVPRLLASKPAATDPVAGALAATIPTPPSAAAAVPIPADRPAP